MTSPAPAHHLTAFVDRAAVDDETGVRIRRAMAGESPQRFRDRLLLERAAWLARSSDRTLQDIAAECGFRGYDVFVRAFRRELGASPSAWRADPTTWEIEAPGEVHFHPPDGVLLPARAADDDSPPVGRAYVAAYSDDHGLVPLDGLPVGDPRVPRRT
jgi:AraC-like DNA-binding protein